MGYGYLKNGDCYRFVSMICAQHDCELVEMDFPNRIIRISGPSSAAGACMRALEKVMGKFGGDLRVVDAQKSAPYSTSGNGYAIMH